jgi:lysophospholipase L1-like esterase
MVIAESEHAFPGIYKEEMYMKMISVRSRLMLGGIAGGLALAATGCGGGTQTTTATLQSQTIAFNTIPSQTVGTAVALSATASSGLTVSFASTTTGVCTVNSTTNATRASLIAAGTCTIQATQTGNASFLAATPVSQSFTVNAATSNPAPTIDSISPTFIEVESVAQTVTLTGTYFLTTTTATYGGAAHAITFVNSTTITLSLSVTDQAATGSDEIVLTNPAPGGGTASINLSVVSQLDTMLTHSQLAVGDQARLQRLIQKGRSGSPVTLAAIGGSITQGTGATSTSQCYASLVQDWWNTTFPGSASTLINAGIGATGSDYGSLRVQRDVLSKNPDLVIIEFAVNDLGNEAGLSDTYEGLLRQVLDAPFHPAVILLFMMEYGLPVVEANMTAQPWQSAIGANYNVPMVSYFDAIGPELTNGNITLSEITADDVHPSNLGHAYAAQFIAQNIQNAIDHFPAGSALEDIPATAAPLHSADFEFTSLQDGIGDDGPALDPTANSGWADESANSMASLYWPPSGLFSSTPGSTLDFTVTGKEILIGYWVSGGPTMTAPMGEASVTVDGVAYYSDLDGWFGQTWGGYRGMTRVGSGLVSGPHQVQITLLSTEDTGGSTGHDFIVLSVGAGGVE